MSNHELYSVIPMIMVREAKRKEIEKLIWNIKYGHFTVDFGV